MSTTAHRPSLSELPRRRFQSLGSLHESSDSAFTRKAPRDPLSQLASPPLSDTETDDQFKKVLDHRIGHVRPSTRQPLNQEKLSVAKRKGNENGDNNVHATDSQPLLTSSLQADLISTPRQLNNGEHNEHESSTKDNEDTAKQKTLKLSPEKLHDLTHSPTSLPVRALFSEAIPPIQSSSRGTEDMNGGHGEHQTSALPGHGPELIFNSDLPTATSSSQFERRPRNLTIQTNLKPTEESPHSALRPHQPQRALSTPANIKSPFSPRKIDKTSSTSTTAEEPGKPDLHRLKSQHNATRPLPSPMPSSIPLPPLSFPTYLQLELSSQRPSQLYIYRSANSDFPYESSRVKIERLLNFLLLPLQLESVLWFGTLACIDAWLYTFTILPLRLLKSFYILGQSWMTRVLDESSYVSNFIYNGIGRVWRRKRNRPEPLSRRSSHADRSDPRPGLDAASRSPSRSVKHHRRAPSMPSTLMPDDKADILKGLLIICTCVILLRLDASRMYHWIRGQSAIKLYVIYNVLEVCDRLFSALGQDVLECLFSRETLERKPNGHSKVLRPFWLFLLALTYTVIHSTALFYQVITLNVAVNSYSNALITLLISNQFVEIKSTVFKKFEKENLFQLTCADVVERFQLWHMLIIIASRNIVETGGLSKGFSILNPSASSAFPSSVTNTSHPVTHALPPLTVSSILPRSFTLVPEVVASITTYVPVVSHVLGPFLVVLGSEMLVDWLKHAYISKFNNTKPAIYGRFLDVLAKDYYLNAFGDQNLTKRLGLPVIPLSCLLIRAMVQTYHMFMAAWVPSLQNDSSTSLTSIYQHYSASRTGIPASTTARLMIYWDEMLRGIPASFANSYISRHFTTVLIGLLVFFILLASKLVLGMLLLSFARSRYKSMKERERHSIHQVEGGKRIGGWGVVEVDEDKRRWIYDDDPAEMRALREREEKDRLKREKEKASGAESLDSVKRYEMVAKRIW